MRRTAIRANPETTRAWQNRSRAPLARTEPLRRRGKKASARHDDAFGPQSELCRRLPCETCLAEAFVALRSDNILTEAVIERLLCWAERSPGEELPFAPSEPHHFPCRPIGKDNATGPECRRHHEEWHGKLGARGHARKYRIDLRKIRAALAAWIAAQGTTE